MENLWTVDAHCHWSNTSSAPTAGQMEQMLAKGIHAFQLAGVEPNEWARQTELRARYPKQIWRAFGLHPYFVALNPQATLEAAWTTLTLAAPELEALGEMGLDFRAAYLQQGKEHQQDHFRRGLELATQTRKPVILHIVRAHEEALKILPDFTLTGMVHGFTASAQVAKRYLDLGYHLSFGAKVLFPGNEALGEAVRQCPLERILIESDAPDQPPPGLTTHDSTTVWAVAKEIGRQKNLSLEQVITQTRSNYLRLIDREITL